MGRAINRSEPQRGRTGFAAAFRDRYLQVVGSIYLYNEHRGYTSLDRVLDAARRFSPDDQVFLTAVAKHRADERKHYLMFKRWFELRGEMPFAVDHGFGHIDRFIRYAFGVGIDELDTDGVVADAAAFEKLCRVIVMTEQRGLVQVDELLRHRAILSDAAMTRIFQVIHRDEPSHFLPYRAWLERSGRPAETWRERAADWRIHKTLLLLKLPALFVNQGAARLARWPDADEAPA